MERSPFSGTEKSQKRKRNVELVHPFTAAGSRFTVPWEGSVEGGKKRKTSVKYDRRAMVCEMVMLGADLVESVWEKYNYYHTTTQITNKYIQFNNEDTM